MIAKDHETAQLGRDSEASLGGKEVALFQRVGYTEQRRVWIDATAGKRDGLRIDVGGKDPRAKLRQLVAQRLTERYRQRIRLLPRGASRRPYAELSAAQRR